MFVFLFLLFAILHDFNYKYAKSTFYCMLLVKQKKTFYHRFKRPDSTIPTFLRNYSALSSDLNYHNQILHRLQTNLNLHSLYFTSISANGIQSDWNLAVTKKADGLHPSRGLPSTCLGNAAFQKIRPPLHKSLLERHHSSPSTNRAHT